MAWPIERLRPNVPDTVFDDVVRQGLAVWSDGNGNGDSARESRYFVEVLEFAVTLTRATLLVLDCVAASALVSISGIQAPYGEKFTPPNMNPLGTAL